MGTALSKQVSTLGVFLCSISFLLSTLVCAAAPSPSASSPAGRDDLIRLLSLIDYIRGDYGEAVANDGTVKDADEFIEMQQFGSTCEALFTSLSPSLEAGQRQAITTYLSTLNAQIAKKSPYHEIQATTELAKDQLIASFAIKTGPQKVPSLALAQAAYTRSCASCHGPQADGKGPLAGSLDPAPRNFHDKGKAATSSPFKFYNSTLLGVPGTSMPSFRQLLSDEELWSISFFLAEMPYTAGTSGSLSQEARHQSWEALPQEQRQKMLNAGLSLELLAGSSEDDLLSWLTQHVPELLSTLGDTEAGSREAALDMLRSAAPYRHEVPLTALSGKGGDEGKSLTKTEKKSQQVLAGLHLARTKLEDAIALYAKGEHSSAEKQLLDAYLFGFEVAEISLRLADAQLVKAIEGLFIEARTMARDKDDTGFRATTSLLRVKLDDAEEALAANYGLSKKASGWGSFAGSMVIILREGFEAFLLIAALLSLLTTMGATHAKRWVHWGWICALLAGFVSFAVFEEILHLSGAAKETIEALSTGIAVVFLFYTGFWLLSQSERMQWSRFIKNKTTVALSSGRLWGLFSISFIAVYREAAETMLFYAALYSTTSSPLLVTSGFLFGCVVLISICWGIVRYNVRLPIKQFFLVTSCFMLSLAVILAGKTIHELVEAGYIETTPLSWMPAVEVLGLYPSRETLAAQLALIGLGALLAWYLRRKKNPNAG